MTDEEILNIIVRQYALETSIPSDVRERIQLTRDKNLKIILKKTGNYSIAVGLITSIFLLLKKAGLSVSFIKTAIIAGIVTTVTAVTITGTALIKIIDTLTLSPGSRVEENSYATLISSGTSQKRLKVMTFSASEGSIKVEEKFRAALILNLYRTMGDHNEKDSSGRKKNPYVVTGSVDRLAEGYLITTKIINPGNGVIVFYDLSEIRSESQIPETSSAIASRISEKIK